MFGWNKPSADNDFLAPHIHLLQRSFTHWTGKTLLEAAGTQSEQARQIFYAPFVIVSHDAAPHPIFTYGNDLALELFGMTWEAFTSLPSSQSAELAHQNEREHFLATVAQNGYMTSYHGIRVAQNGRRFRIDNVTLWNLVDETNTYCGQAAMFKDWTFLD